MSKIDNVLEDIKEKAPEMLKENKGALVGLAIGYALSGDDKAQTTLLAGILGSLVVDKKKEEV